MADIALGGGDRERIQISLSARTRPSDTDYWDGNWLNADVTAHVGGFRARVSGNVRSEEFVAFRKQIVSLDQSLRGEASFATMENWLTLRLRGDGRGHIEVELGILDRPGIGNRLTGRLDLDQSCLSPLLRQLDRVIEEFPVRGLA
jgi:hypothetical protein